MQSTDWASAITRPWPIHRQVLVCALSQDGRRPRQFKPDVMQARAAWWSAFFECSGRKYPKAMHRFSLADAPLPEQPVPHNRKRHPGSA